MTRLFVLLWLLILPITAGAGDDALDEAALAAFEFDSVMSDIATPQSDKPAELIEHRIENEFWYFVMLAVVSMLTLLLVLWFLKQKPETTPKDIVSAAGLTLVVFGTIILVLIVDTTEQLTAATGILGAIAGYLFRSVQEKVEVKVAKPQDDVG